MMCSELEMLQMTAAAGAVTERRLFVLRSLLPSFSLRCPPLHDKMLIREIKVRTLTLSRYHVVSQH